MCDLTFWMGCPAPQQRTQQIRGVCDEWGLPPSSVLVVGDSLGA